MLAAWNNVLGRILGTWGSGEPRRVLREWVLGTLSHSCLHSGTYFSFDSIPSFLFQLGSWSYVSFIIKILGSYLFEAKV